MYHFAYLIGDGILAIFWLVLFFSRKDLRKQQLFMSFVFSAITPFAEWIHRDYWSPLYTLGVHIFGIDVRIESLLFAFLISGITTVIYEVIFRKRHFFGKPRGILTVIIISAAIILVIILNKLGLNSIWATSLSIIAGSIIMTAIDHDLIKDAIWSSILTMVLIVISYFVWVSIYPEGFQKFWFSSALSGVKLWKIPIEEIVWFTCTGAGFGILYEFWLNVNKYPKKLKR